MAATNIILTPHRQALPAGFDSTLDVLVRIAAPDAPDTAAPPRSPLHLAVVIDRSGSMSGHPLAEAGKAAAFIVNHLAAGDRASLVVFDDHVQTLVPLREIDDRTVFHQALANIHSGGSTNLHGGWLAGAESLAPKAKPQVTSRVILLSDGCANAGLTDAAAIDSQCTELATAGVTTSTYGLGANFNEALMIGMSRAGRGNAYYGETAADLMDPFREEFALLNALCARDLVLQIALAPGVRAEVLNNYPPASGGGHRLPDLAYGGEAWALTRLTVPATAEGSDPHDLMTVKVQHRDMSGEPVVLEPVSLRLAAVSAAVFGTLAEDPLVLRRVGELEAARLQEEARGAAQRGDWASVDVSLARASALGADNSWIKGAVAELKRSADRRDQQLFSKGSSYNSLRMKTRLAPKMESDELSAEEVSFLRRKFSQGKAEPDPKGKG